MHDVIPVLLRGGLDIKYLWLVLGLTSSNQGALDVYCNHASTIEAAPQTNLINCIHLMLPNASSFPNIIANCLTMPATSHILSPVIPSITFTTQAPFPAPFSPLAAKGLLPSSPIPEVPTFLPAVCANRDLGFALFQFSHQRSTHCYWEK